MYTSRPRHHALGVLALSLLVIAPALEAQVGGPQGNRQVIGIATEAGTAAGTHAVSVIWSATVDGPSSVPADWSGQIDLLIGGTVVASATQTAVSLFTTTDCALAVGCQSGNCGSWDDGTTIVDGFCREVLDPAGGTDCGCGALFLTTLPPVPMSPGDEIMIILMPVPGALPDSNPTDDTWVETFTGPIPGPNRGVTGLSLSTDPATGGTLVHADVVLEAGPTNAEIDFGTVADVFLNGVLLTSVQHPYQLGPDVGSCEGPAACSNPDGCALWQVAGNPAVAGTCLQSGAQQNCACTLAFSFEVPTSPLAPGDEIMVLLRPASGAIPDLPGLGGDDLAIIGPPATSNRRLVGISARPDPSGGGHEVFAIWEGTVAPSTAPQDLGTEVELRVNGVAVTSTIQAAVSLSATDCALAGSCSTGICGSWDDGVTIVDGFCRDTAPGTGTPDCACGSLFITALPPTPLSPGDEIMVLLRPAPGALPDGDPSDDTWLQTFTGPIAGPNRVFDGASLVPQAGGGHALVIEMHAESGPSNQVLDFDTEIEVLLNGAVIGTQTETLKKDPEFGSCDGPLACVTPDGCALWTKGVQVPLGGTCLQSVSQQNCACSYTFTYDFGGVPFQPGDEIMVLLRPAPGALPDLPGLAGDDSGLATPPPPPPTTNRRVASASTRPATAPGMHHVTVVWEGLVGPSSTTQDLTTGIDLLVNGTLVESVTQTALALGAIDCGLGGGCSTAACGSWDDGVIVSDGTCRDTANGTGPADCKCGHWFASELPPVPMAPGDELMIILYPAPGALPDSDTSDDVLVQTFDGHIAGSNRRIAALSRTPSSAGGSDVHLEIALERGPSALPVDLSFQVEIASANSPGTAEIEFVEVAGGSEDLIDNCDLPTACLDPTGCSLWTIAAVPVGGTCLDSPSQQNCVCSYVLVYDLGNVPVPPDEGLVVVLKPVPGALPELPGFPDDDEGEDPPLPPTEPPFTRGDCNTDGAYDIGDPVSLLGELFSGAAPAPCDDACDANDDGGKDIGDAVYMLASLFSGGASPPDPFTACGPDPTDDSIGCGSFPPCE